MAKMGLYKELPLPDEWLPVLNPLQLTANLPATRSLPSFGVLVDECLSSLEERQSQMVWRRFGEDQTLQTVGDANGLTRERVRQLISKALKSIWRKEQYFTVLKGVWDALTRHGATVVDVREAVSTSFPTAMPDQLWRFVVALWELGHPVHHVRVAEGVWLVSADAFPNGRKLRSLMQAAPQFFNLDELALALDLEPEQAAFPLLAVPDLWITTSGRYGHRGWTLPQWIQAIASQLGEAGYVSWHFSEMAQALAYVNPQDFSGLPGRNVAAVVSRPNVTAFEYAGCKGYWRLRHLGDGHSDNATAIRSILEAAEFPLPAHIICQRLQRDVAEGTVYALLGRDPVFERLGFGAYGLRGRLYPTRFVEEEWLQARFDEFQTEELLEEQVHQLAVAAGVDIERLQCIGRFSTHFRWWQRGIGPARYISVRREAIRRFERWFEHRREREACPSADVLSHGLQDAFQRRDYTKLSAVVQALDAERHDLPPATQAWLAWARERMAPP